SHLVNVFQRGEAFANLGQPAFAQCGHAFLAGYAFNFWSWAALHDHVPDAVCQIEQFANRGAAVITSPRALQASSAFGKRDVAPYSGIETRFLQFCMTISVGLLAALRDHAYQPFGHAAGAG